MGQCNARSVEMTKAINSIYGHGTLCIWPYFPWSVLTENEEGGVD